MRTLPHVKDCTREEALAILRPLPRPSPAQIEEFIDYFKSRRSWYKHLPVLRGDYFMFYLNPAVGYYSYSGLLQEEQSMHYVLSPQARVEQCGYLDFYHFSRTSNKELRMPKFYVRRDANDYTAYKLPADLLGSGAVRLNACIRSCSGCGSIWSGNIKHELDRLPEEFQFPVEAGGIAAFEGLKIMVQDGRAKDNAVWQPAMLNQQRLIRKAINQMLDYVYEGIEPKDTWFE